MYGAARYFWRLFIKKAREFLVTLNDESLRHYCEGVEILDRLEKLVLHHTQKGEFEREYLKYVEPNYIVSLLLNSHGHFLPIKVALQRAPNQIYGLSGRGLLSRTLIWEVAVLGMSEEVVVAQELSLRRSEDLQAAGGPPDPPPAAPQKRLRSPRSPARVEHERVATPPKEPAGSGSAEEPITIGSKEDPGVIPAEGVTTSGPTQTATPPDPSNDTPADVVAPEGVTTVDPQGLLQ
ncbi:unnamed protein product [Calypogeia fissa]